MGTETDSGMTRNIYEISGIYDSSGVNALQSNLLAELAYLSILG